VLDMQERGSGGERGRGGEEKRGEGNHVDLPKEGGKSFIVFLVPPSRNVVRGDRRSSSGKSSLGKGKKYFYFLEKGRGAQTTTGGVFSQFFKRGFQKRQKANLLEPKADWAGSISIAR